MMNEEDGKQFPVFLHVGDSVLPAQIGHTDSVEVFRDIILSNGFNDVEGSFLLQRKKLRLDQPLVSQQVSPECNIFYLSGLSGGADNDPTKKKKKKKKKRKTNPASRTPIPTDSDFLSKVAELIPLDKYQAVYRTLVPENADRDLEVIKYNHDKDGLLEIKYQVLRTWEKKAPKEMVTVEQLQNALRKNGCKEEADKCPEIARDIDIKDYIRTFGKLSEEEKKMQMTRYIHEVINPEEKDEPQEIIYNALSNKMGMKYGNFQQYNLGSLTSFLEKSDAFVRLQREGRELVSQEPCAWAEQLSTYSREQAASAASGAAELQLVDSCPVNAGNNNDNIDLHNRESQRSQALLVKSKHPNVVQKPTESVRKDTSEAQSPQTEASENIAQSDSRESVTENSLKLEPADSKLNPFMSNDQNNTNPASCTAHTDYSNNAQKGSPSPTLPSSNVETELSLSNDSEGIQQLLQRQGENCLKFVPSASNYCDINSNELFEDVICMWNTISREKAYIVVGAEISPPPPPTTSNAHISEPRLFGINRSQEQTNEFYQSRFKANCFNYVPTFSYSQHESNGRLLGLFTIESSKGAGRPCIQKNTITSNTCSKLPLGAPWCRVRNQNEVVPNTIKDAFKQWFTSTSITSATLLPTVDLPDDSNSMLFREALQALDDHSSVLISNCPSDSGNADLNYLALVPWLKVFDFDVDSPNDNGALSQCEDIIRSKREIRISTWMDTTNDHTSKATEWFFPVGYKRNRVSLCSDTIRQWKDTTSKGVDIICDAIAEYCLSRTPVVIFILWYGEQGYAKHLGHILRTLERLFGSEKSNIRIVLCYEAITSAKESTILEALCEEMDIQVIQPIDLGNVCKLFTRLSETTVSQKSKASEYQLPTSDRTNTPGITASEAAWLKTELDVLYVNYPLTPDDDFNTDEERAKHFYRGGILSWYMLKTSSKEYKYDAKRDICGTVTDKISDLVENGKSAVVELLHEPGSGGTTLGRRILWNTKQSDRAICVRVISLDNVNEVVVRIQKLWDLTSVPIVVLADGFDQTTVRRLRHLLRIGRVQVIILHVQRRTARPDKKSDEESLRFRLRGDVTVDEAPGIAVAFGQYCSDEKKAELLNLALDVKSGKSRHHVFEFGLAAHSHEYFGIRKYVNGYLGPTSQPKSWQNVLSYLALAYFYGHVCIPAQFFVSVGILQRLKGWKPLVDSLPVQARELMIEEKEGSIISWRPRHNLIAKEILEQVLNVSDNRSYDKHNTVGQLSNEARRCLSNFVCQFLDFAARTNMKHKNKAPKEIMEIVVALVINRDTKVDVSQDDKKAYRKPLQSRLLTDIPAQSPYNERMKVLRKVTDAFPGDPNGWAQLGRYCGIWRPNDEDEAEKCFETALQLRKQEIESTMGQKIIDDPDQVHPDQVLSQVCHMYGMLLSRKIRVRTSHQTGRKTFPPEEMNQRGSVFHTTVSDTVDIAKTAVYYFELCREYKGQGNEDTYGYVGEIDLRLAIVDLIESHYPGGFFSYLKCKVADPRTTEFLNECFYTCDYLIRDCYEKVPPDNLHEFAQVVNLFHVLFKGTTYAFDMWQGEDTISNRRSMIVAIKIKARREGNRSVEYSDDVQDVKDMTKLIELHERNLQEVYERDIKLNLDSDMQEWLKFIRHDSFPKAYPIGEVLDMVRKWYDTRNSKHAQFYLFILHTILGIGSVHAGHVGETRNFMEARRLHEEVRKSRVFFSNPRPKREWLGVHDPKRGKTGIKRLVSYKQLAIHSVSRASPYQSRDRDQWPWEIPETRALLETRKGTISSVKKQTAGYINLDDDLTTRQHPLSIFFVPDKFKSNPYHGQRVEFNVAFSIDHGIEALNVSEVTKHKCTNCTKRYEFSELSMSSGRKYKSWCSCGSRIKVDDL